jgi:ribulose-5-phosphate 4-epimerase/fuculose-1-phosphate aldolase
MSVTSLPVEKQSPEWRQRVELAACYRLLAHYKMTDLIYTHATVRVPGEAGRFLINPYGWRWEEITASSLVKIDVDGRKIDDSPHRVNPAGFIIHSAVQLARHDAACVIHTHTRAGMAVSAVKDGLLPISQIALQYYGRLGVHDYEGIALDLDERQRVIRDLGGYCGTQSWAFDRRAQRRRSLQLDVLPQPGLRGAGRDAIYGHRARYSAEGGLREGRQTI